MRSEEIRTLKFGLLRLRLRVRFGFRPRLRVRVRSGFRPRLSLRLHEVETRSPTQGSMSTQILGSDLYFAWASA